MLQQDLHAEQDQDDAARDLGPALVLQAEHIADLQAHRRQNERRCAR